MIKQRKESLTSDSASKQDIIIKERTQQNREQQESNIARMSFERHRYNFLISTPDTDRKKCKK